MSERRIDLSAAGQVATPLPLASRLALLALDRAGPGARFLDPCCGAGDLLLALLRSGHLEGLELPRLHGIEAVAELADEARRRLACSPTAAHVDSGNALDGESAWPGGTWVVANPPWLSFSGRHRARTRDSAENRRRPGGWPSLHGQFVERIARHVGTERTGAFLLVPGSLLDLERYGPTRRAVTLHAHLAARPIELGESAFPGVLEPAVLIELAPGAPPGGPSDATWTVVQRESALLSELARHPRFPPGAFADVGLHTGNAARLLVHPAGIPGTTRLRQGRDLHPYSLGPASAGLARERPKGPRLYYHVRAPESYRAYPILLRQTANRPVAALHDQPACFRNSLLACRGVEGLDPAFVVAVLNAPTSALWHRAHHRDSRQRTFPQVKVGHLAGQPLPFERRERDARLHDEVVERVRALGILDPREIARERAAIEERIADAFGLSPEAREELSRFGVLEEERAHSSSRDATPPRRATCVEPC